MVVYCVRVEMHVKGEKGGVDGESVERGEDLGEGRGGGLGGRRSGRGRWVD